MKLLALFSERMQTSLLEETERRYFLFVCIYALLSLVAGAMTVANIITRKGPLTIATLAYAIFCALIFLLLLRHRIALKLSQVAFVASFFLLLSYFIITGIPDGFSILWVCFLPACGLLAFGRKAGTLICAGMLLELILLLDTPIGQSIVLYEYSSTFQMRFPLLYTAFYFASLLLETIREMTQNKLVEAQARYRYLYTHDALTEVYNRYGFNELMDRYFQKQLSNLALIILDIDYFKGINDRFGHLQGDAVLQQLSRVIVQAAGAQSDVCRWGGEEFAVLIPDCADPLAAAGRIRSSIRSHAIPLGSAEITITVSIGAALIRKAAACSAAQLVNLADACLYRAKQNGRDRIEFCEMESPACCDFSPQEANNRYKVK